MGYVVSHIFSDSLYTHTHTRPHTHTHTISLWRASVLLVRAHIEAWLRCVHVGAGERDVIRRISAHVHVLRAGTFLFYESPIYESPIYESWFLSISHMSHVSYLSVMSPMYESCLLYRLILCEHRRI